ncbi:MAG: hypothetical protein CMM50_17020 [Rhodospirillaceae bacterium]|nr:hypothetical protein [Rhodospirillaceae bacterium]
MLSRLTRSITFKYSTVIFVLCLACVALTGGMAHYKSSKELESSVESDLIARRDSRITSLAAYLNSVRQDLRIIAEAPTTENALRDFSLVWKDIRDQDSSALQSLYTATVPFFDRQEGESDTDDPVIRYNSLHDEYHYWFWKLLFERGYYDLFLIDTAGNIIYSALKESDFGTNITKAPNSAYGLNTAFSKALADGKREVFVDFAPYPPSDGLPAGFLATSIVDDEGTLLGVLALQVPITKINAAMQINTSIGETGELLLVGADLRARGGSRFRDTAAILDVEVDMPTVRSALDGESGLAVVKDYRGRQVYSAYGTIDFLGTFWAVLADIDRDEVLAPVKNTTRFILSASSVIFVVVLALGIFFGSRLSRPISDIAHAMRDLADGDFSVATPYAARRDEVGDLASALETFKQAKLQAAAASAELEAYSKQLQEREERLSLVLRGGDLGYWDVDLDSGQTLVNERYNEIFGFPAGQREVSRDDWIGLIHPADRDHALRVGMRYRSGEELDYEVEYRIVVGGEVHWVVSKGAVVAWNDTGAAQRIVGTVQDVTARKLAEEKLRKSRERLETILLGSPIGVTITAENPFRIPFMNTRFTELFGIDPESAARFEDYVEDTYVDKADFAKLRDAVRSDEPVVTLELQRQRLDGTPWWCLFTRTFAEYNDEPVSINWYVDITNIKDAEAKLRQQTEELDLALLSLEVKEAQLQQIIDDSPVGIAIVRASDSVVVDANPSFCNMVGRPIGQVEKSAVAQFYHPEDTDRRQRILETLAKQTEIRDQEIRLIDSEGNATWVLLSVTPIDTFQGEAARLSWYYNINAQKKAEERLRESERRLREVLETSPVGVGIAVSGRPVFYNTRMLEMLGRDQASYLGQQAAELYVDPSQRDEIVEEVTRVGEVRDREVAFRRADDEIIDTLSSYFPVEYEGQNAILIWLYDITRRKEAERALVDALSVIRESVSYASNIQGSLLPSEQQLANCTQDHFMIWEPRDVVGGDMIWLRECRGGLVLIVCDCTGHGVPGAFMTLIGTGSLNQALIDHPGGEPERLLESMNRHVKQSLKQEGEQGLADDGMELGICRIDAASGDLTFAGARFSLFQLHDGAMSEIKGDRSGIGYRHVPRDRHFTVHAIENPSGSTFYMVSDGMIDQIGGERRRSFGRKRLLQIIEETSSLPLTEQRETIFGRFTEHQGQEIRRDDVTMLAFRPQAVASVG